MAVLVTGAGGFAGRHLIAALQAAGIGEIVGTTLDGEVLPLPGMGSEVRWRAMDLTSPYSIEQVVREVRPVFVYHLAGQASVGASLANPLATWEINASGTLRLLEALRRESPGTRRVLLVSSAEVYGVVPEVAQPITEKTPLAPLTPYGASKAAAEVALLQMGRMLSLEVVIARSFNHIGPGQDERFVLPSMARQLVAMRGSGSERVLRVGNLEVRRDFLDVRDVVRAYLCLMQSASPGQAYNVCSGTARSLLAVVERMVELSGSGARIAVDAERLRPVDIPLLVGDPGRLQALGWKPEIELDATLTELLREAEARYE